MNSPTPASEDSLLDTAMRRYPRRYLAVMVATATALAGLLTPLL